LYLNIFINFFFFKISRIQDHYRTKVKGKDDTIEKLKEQLDTIRSDYQGLRREALINVS